MLYRDLENVKMFQSGTEICLRLSQLLVFISTLALRQHVLVDVFSGILVAEVTWQISRRTNGYRIYQRIIENMSDWLQHIINRLKHVWKDLFFGPKGKQLTGGKEEWQIRKK